MHQATAFRPGKTDWRPPDFPAEHKTFSHGSAKVGAAAHVRPSRAGQHYLHMALLAAPLVIGELVHDSQKRWRYIRLCSLVGALLTEGMYQKGRGQWQDRVGREDGERER
jgi:hypothetical protein